jgi:hypothetical protein
LAFTLFTYSWVHSSLKSQHAHLIDSVSIFGVDGNYMCTVGEA